METQQQQSEQINSVSPTSVVGLEREQTDNLPKLPAAEGTKFQFQQISQQATQFLDKLPDSIGNFLNENRQVIFTLLFVVLSIILAKAVIAILSAVQRIPILALFFEIIGLSYTSWFTTRYLLQSQTRQELIQKISELKQRAFG